MLHTTFAIAHKAHACKESYIKFAESVGGINKYGKDTPIPLIQVLDVCGLDDALWCLFCVLPKEDKERDKIARLFACDCAEHVIGLFEKQYPDDKRPRQAIDIARRFAQGEASINELAAARDAAWDAARAAARDAARDAARAAAWAAAWDAAWAAARDAARAAAWAAAWDAARDAERKWQEAKFREYMNAPVTEGVI